MYVELFPNLVTLTKVDRLVPPRISLSVSRYGLVLTQPILRLLPWLLLGSLRLHSKSADR